LVIIFDENIMKFQQFERIFKPRSVAVVGASKNPSKMGSFFLVALEEMKRRRDIICLR
jgi:acyl-CoA synthetase (NDP forming)